MDCCYGCGNPATYTFKNGKQCCSKYRQKCPALKKINSEKNIGKKHSIETIEYLRKINIGENNPMYGKSHIAYNKGKPVSDDIKIKLSNIHKSRYSDPNYVNPNKGRKMSTEEKLKRKEIMNNPEVKEKLRNAQKNNWNNKNSWWNKNKDKFIDIRRNEIKKLKNPNPKYTTDIISNILNELGCKLNGEYINSKIKIKYICINNHTAIGNLSNIRKSKGRCKQCANDAISGKNHYKWNDNRENIKLKNKLYFLCKDLLKRVVKLSGKLKYTEAENLLGYSKNQLLEHLQTNIYFNEWINDSKNYHIDHIFPVSIFFEYNIIDPKIINSLDNLQILPAKENIKKKDRYDVNEFLNYIKSKGIQ